MACSARYSCQKEKRPFTRITPTIAHPSVAIPAPGSCSAAPKASPAATQRMQAKKWLKPFRNFRNSGSPAHSCYPVRAKPGGGGAPPHSLSRAGCSGDSGELRQP